MNILQKVHELRDKSVATNRCSPPPFGCGRPVNALDFTDALSAKEYQISGLCQTCQDAFFKEEEE